MKYLLACLLLISCLVQAEQAPLRFAIKDSWGMPLAQIENGRAVSGVLVDLQQLLAEKVGRSAELVVLPHRRVQSAMDSGSIDVRCYSSPSWSSSRNPRFVWTHPFMLQRDLLVSTEPGDSQAEQLPDVRIGTVAGYNYPRLNKLFESGQISREDTRTQDQVLLKLAAKRYRYAISNETSLNWFNRQRAPADALHVHSVLAAVPVSCVVRNEPGVPTTELLQAMEQLVKDGEIEKILQRYRLPAASPQLLSCESPACYR